MLVLLRAGAALAADAGEVVDEADADVWRGGAGLETWAYATRNAVRRDSVLNPDNRMAGIASGQALLDARLNLRFERAAVDTVLAARLLERADWTRDAADTLARGGGGAARLDQAFLRYKSKDDMLPTVVLGRELFSWGPANFRSPGNPFYFDAGRSNPMAVTPGIDLLRGTWKWGALRFTAARVLATDQVTPAEDAGRTTLFKLDRQGGDYLLSLIVSRQSGAPPFAGGFFQSTLSDAWLLYGEFGSQRQAAALLPGGIDGPPFSVRRPAPRSASALLGASYTLENGQALAAEYLHDSGGYDAQQGAAYFSRAGAADRMALDHPAAGYAALGEALTLAPRLLGRDYVWLDWQSGAQDSGRFWRLAWSYNLRQHSGQAQLYGEKTLLPRLSAFASLTANTGGARREFGALLVSVASVGLKWFAW